MGLGAALLPHALSATAAKSHSRAAPARENGRKIGFSVRIGGLQGLERAPAASCWQSVRASAARSGCARRVRMHACRVTAIALSIAGSDPSGGAGIQADLKTFAALGVYGATVITALTAQNTQGVAAIEMVAPGFVAAQMDAVCADLGVNAVKIGMLGTAA